MYASFYIWHGVFLNDLNHINFSKPLFFVLVALVYFVVSFVLYRTYEVKLLDKYFSNALIKGVVAGTIVGFFLFSVVAVLGVSFTKQVNTTYLLADCIWQVVEQIIGGVVIGFGKLFIFEPTHDMRHAD
jgi:hypothetical protein